MASEPIKVIAGIDTHADTHHVAVINEHGKPLADREFLAVGSGYRKIIDFIASKANGPGEKTLCPGVSYMLTGTDGEPLTSEETRLMEKHLRAKCGKDKAATKGEKDTSSDGTLTPMAKWTSYGYLAANLALSPGNMTYSASASSMPTGMWKSVSCSIQRNWGSWQHCGSASGTGSYLSTRSNWECPYPGQKIALEAWLDINDASFYDVVYGETM